ncbi:hypothetical protein AB0M68_35975 [Streptomyces sp. NPDC051453]|uniref:hypothetical protein n=1 Tax=Streptomyces sp. NPDC051453 TaxID=3154941 RepID=UPI00342863DB
MYVDARYAAVRLAEPQDLATFSVVADDLQTLMERAGQFGYLTDGSAFVRCDWLRASGPETSEWAAALEKMLAFAASSGWLHEGHVQAHIVWPGPETD